MMNKRQKKKCPICFGAITVGTICSCGYDDRLKEKMEINNKQKWVLIIAIFSAVIFLSTWYHYSNTGVRGTFFGSYIGITYDNVIYHTNWVGFFSIATFLCSIVAFFLFRNK